MNTHINDHHNYSLSVSMMISELAYQAVVRIENVIKVLHRMAA